MTTITLPAVFDSHLHLRQSDMLRRVAPYSAAYCERVLLMPNTLPPICHAGEINSYRMACRLALGQAVEPLMTFKLTPRTTPQDVRLAKDAGAVGAKLYPEGVTTHSGDGISVDVLRALADGRPGPLGDVLTEMERLDLVLLQHGEMPEDECLLREESYLPVTEAIVRDWPKLRVTMEHITSQWTVSAIRALAKGGARVAATITLQHLLCTVDDVLIGSSVVGRQGGKLRPHNHCLPVPKYRADRAALQRAAVGAEPYFFLGSDSAPHARENKECADCCAGVWSAPVLLPSLVEFFDGLAALPKLPDFINGYASAFYGVRPTGRTITVVGEPWKVPAELDGVVPFRAGETLKWSVMGDDLVR